MASFDHACGRNLSTTSKLPYNISWSVNRRLNRRSETYVPCRTEFNVSEETARKFCAKHGIPFPEPEPEKPKKKPNRAAYLNVHCQIQPGFLPSGVILGASIHSEPAQSLTRTFERGKCVFWATVLEAQAPTYQKARDQIMDTVKALPHLRPLLVWLDESLEAHDARGILGRLAKGGEI